MRMPLLSMSAETLLDTYGLYHLTQLQADPELTEITETFRQTQERLNARNEEYRDAEAASLVALAVRDRKDTTLDEAVMAFNHAVLEYVRKDRRAPLYVKYFADGLRPLTVAPLASEIRRVGTMLAKLAAETVEDLKSHAEPLATALAELEAAMVAQQKALDAEAQAYGVLQSEKIAWLDVYRQDHGRLQIHFHDRPRRAEAYFRPAPPVKEPEKVEPTPGDGPETTPSGEDESKLASTAASDPADRT